MIRESAPAKINLTLHVTRRRDDGYHLLDSLVVFAGVEDTIFVETADTLSLTVDGPFSDGVPTDHRNLVWKAAQFLSDTKGAGIALTKVLPHGGGIGGGSSDAAATLRALSALWGRPLPPAARAATLGADIPVCLAAPAPMVMSGIGDLLAPAPPLPAAHLLLVNPGVEVPTPQVFAALREDGPVARAPMTGIDRLANFSSLPAFAKWLGTQRNDLLEPAQKLAPVIGQVLEAIRTSTHCRAHNMSGSGSTCWGLFETAAQAQSAAATISAGHPEWWVQTGSILTPQ